jgi:hypothetical protein
VTVTAERREAMRKIADAHDEWVPQHLDTPFEPVEEDKSVYNQHYVDLDTDGKAQDEYTNQVAAIMGDQTAATVAAWNAKNPEHPKGPDGKWAKGSAVSKALEAGQPDGLAGFTREQLQREVRRRNRAGADIKLRRGASIDEIKEALTGKRQGEPPKLLPGQRQGERLVAGTFMHPDDEQPFLEMADAAEANGFAIPPGWDHESRAKFMERGLIEQSGSSRSSRPMLSARGYEVAEALRAERSLGEPSEVTQARQKLERAVQMHGSDRSKWSKKDRDAAARLDRVIRDYENGPEARQRAVQSGIEAARELKGSVSPDDVRADIRAAVAAKAEPGKWVRLAEVREDLAAKGYTAQEQDSALRALGNDPDVQFIPVANLKSLSPADREGAVKVGGELKHLIKIGAPSREQSAPSASATTNHAAIAALRQDLAGATGADRDRISKMIADLEAESAAPNTQDIEAVHEAARERQRKIDAARDRANVLAEIDEIAANQAEPRVMEHRIRALMRRNGLQDDPDLKELLDGDFADFEKLQNAATRIAENLGLTRLGGEIVAEVQGARGRGEQERGLFRRGEHKPIGESIRDGAVVDIIRPGYKTQVDGQDVTLFPADVQRSTNEPVLSERPLGRRNQLEPQTREQQSREAMTKVEAIRDALRSTPGGDRTPEQGARERARDALAQLSKPQLGDVARELGVPVSGRATKPQLIRDIVEGTVGWLLTTRAIERPLSARNQTAAADSPDDGTVLDEAFSASLEAAMELGDDATEEEFAAEFMAEFASRMPEHLARYWTQGEGAARVRWFVRGAFRRCRRVLRSEGVPGRMLDGTCANLYHRATGRWPVVHKTQTAAVEGDEFAALDAVELGELVDILTEEMNSMDNGTQTACGCGDAETVSAAPEMAADGEVWLWEGRLAPVAAPTGDAEPRMFAPGALSGRGLPRALRWQPRQERGHDGAVVVGALTSYRLDEQGNPWGTAYFFDEKVIPEAGQARYLVEHGVVAPSVDLEPSMDVAFTDEQGNTFNPMTCAADGSCPTKPRSMITRGTIASATLVPIAAFGELGAGRVYRGPKPDADAYRMATQIAAVQSSGWDDMPIADKSHPWDASAAGLRVAEWAADGDGVDWERYGQAFLWRGEDAGTKGAFKFPVADVIDGELAIIPRAVFAAAARLNQASLPADAVDGIRDVLSDLYDQMAEEFDDDDLIAPWDDDREEMSAKGCGCAAKMGAMVPDGTQTASAGCSSCGAKYGVFGNMEPYPADAFGPVKFTQLTPVHIEQRPGEPFARISGHIGDWKGCNRSFRHVCLPPPKSRTNYAEFHTAGHVRTPDGLLRVGKVVMGEGHPDSSVPARVARAYYDATSKEVAHVKAYEDEFAPYINGVLAPGVTPEEATKLLASPVSGDWKNHELIAVLAVNVAGHPIRTSATFDANGVPRNVVAAGRFWLEDDDDVSEAVEVLWTAEHEQLLGVIG